MTFGPINALSSYLPIEFNMPPDDEIMREIITQRERLTASIVNIKENANYEKFEILSAMQWFSTTAPTVNAPDKKRYGFRTTVDLVALNGGVIGAGYSINFISNNSSSGNSRIYHSPPLSRFGNSNRWCKYFLE